MSWIKLDDRFFTHPKAVAVGAHGRALYLASLCWCSSHETDGRIPVSSVKVLWQMAETPRREQDRTVANLLVAGLWHDEGDHYEIHDYLGHQRSRDQIEKERARSRATSNTYNQRRRRQAERRNGNGHVDQALTVSTGGQGRCVTTVIDMGVDRELTATETESEMTLSPSGFTLRAVNVLPIGNETDRGLRSAK